MIGFEPARRALSRRSCGLWPIPVMAERYAIVLDAKIERNAVSVVVHSSGTRIPKTGAMGAEMAATHSSK